MASEACLSVLLAMPSYAWRKGLRTPRTGGEWWEHRKAPARETKRAGPDLPHRLCFAEWCPHHDASAQPRLKPCHLQNQGWAEFQTFVLQTPPTRPVF